MIRQSLIAFVCALSATQLSSAFAQMSLPTSKEKVGATLHKKVGLLLADIPAQAMQEIKALQPDFEAKEAEKELKHGNTYLDIEGEVDGREIEFDMLQTERGWQVVEVQRDLVWQQLPKTVIAELEQKQPKLKPKRIIESIQHGKDVTIYELYSVDQAGKEAKTEVKLENGQASLLDKEWTH